MGLRLPRMDEEFRPIGGKLSPLDPMDIPGKCAAAEERLTPVCVLPWLSLLRRLPPRTPKAELRRWSLNCLLRSRVSLFCEASFSAGAAELSDGDDISFLGPLAPDDAV